MFILIANIYQLINTLLYIQNKTYFPYYWNIGPEVTTNARAVRGQFVEAEGLYSHNNHYYF